jgi:hypothetical protein
MLKRRRRNRPAVDRQTAAQRMQAAGTAAGQQKLSFTRAPVSPAIDLTRAYQPAYQPRLIGEEDSQEEDSEGEGSVQGNQRHVSAAKVTADLVTPGFELMSSSEEEHSQEIHNTTFEDEHADADTESDGGLFSVPASASSGTLNSPLTRSDDVTWTDLQCATWIVDDNTSAAALLRYLKQSEYWTAAAAVRTDLDVGRSLLDLVEENPDSHIATLRLWAMAVAVHWQFTMASVGCGELLMGVLLHFPVQNKLVIANEAGVNPGYCQTLRTLYSDAGQSSRQMLMSDLFSVQMELTHTAAKCAMLAVLTTRLQTVGLTLAAYTRHSLTAHEELLALYAPERAPTYTFGVNPNRAYEVHRTELPAVEARGTTSLLHPAAGAGTLRMQQSFGNRTERQRVHDEAYTLMRRLADPGADACTRFTDLRLSPEDAAQLREWRSLGGTYVAPDDIVYT